MLAVFPDAFPDACRVSGCDSGNNRWIPLCYLASGGSKISNKTRLLWKTRGHGLFVEEKKRSRYVFLGGNKNTVCCFGKSTSFLEKKRPISAHIGPYWPIFYTYSMQRIA